MESLSKCIMQVFRKSGTTLQNRSQYCLNVQVGNNIIPAGPLSSRDNIEVGFCSTICRMLAYTCSVRGAKISI